MRKKTNTEIIISAFMRGYELEYQGRKWCFSNDNHFCTTGYRLKLGDDSKPQEVLLTLDWSVNDFINWCENIPEEKIFELISTIVLTEYNRKDR